MNSAEENKARVRRFYEEIDKGNIGILGELVAETTWTTIRRHFPAPRLDGND